MAKFVDNLAARFYADLQDAQKKLEEAQSDLANADKKIAALSAENNELKDKLKKITRFHCYQVGKHVVEAKKSWGTLLGGMIGSWKYYASVSAPKNEGAGSKNSQ